MKKKILSVISLILAMVFVLCSCGTTNKKTADESTNNHVKLVMYLIGDEPEDYKEVLAQINTMLNKDINAELEVRWMAWGEWSQKYPMLLSSGEPFDLIYTVGYMGFQNYAQSKGFKDITELFPKYAPKTYEALSKENIQKVTYGGKIYAVPANFLEVNPNGYVVRGDLREKYNLPEVNSLDTFFAYLDAVKQNEDIMPFNASVTDSVSNFGWASVGGTIANWDYVSGDYEKLFLPYDKPEYLDFLKKMREGYQKGYWSKDVIMNKLSSKDAFLNGTSASTVSNMKNFADLYATAKETHPEWKVEWAPLEDAKNYPTLLMSNGAGIAISNSSKNPERALMLLELFNQDERYFNLTTYGIEGKNYIINDDGYLELPDGVTADTNGFPADGAGNYGWRNNNYMKSFVREWKGYEEYESKIMENTLWDPYNGFMLDSSAIQNKITAISSVTEQYLMPLYWGTIEPEKGLKEMREKLKAAGLDEVFDEVQRQAQEYLKSR
ncbi:MAG: extracellular solute-binding protein [Clostridia bacterium]|nr:extracellular solute-binding protein [Clostridia bacterium]